MGRIVGAIVLLDAWINRMLAKIHLTDEVEKVRLERIQAEQRLRRLGKAYVEGLYADVVAFDPGTVGSGSSKKRPTSCMLTGKPESCWRTSLLCEKRFPWPNTGSFS